jgi:hypothetical protein
MDLLAIAAFALEWAIVWARHKWHKWMKKQEMADAGVQEGTHQGHSLLDIILEIRRGFFNGLAHVSKRSKMDTGIDLVLSRDTFQQGAIAHATLVERHACFQSRAMAADQIIQNDNFFTIFP